MDTLKYRRERNYTFEEIIKAIWPKGIKFIHDTALICIIKLECKADERKEAKPVEKSLQLKYIKGST